MRQMKKRVEMLIGCLMIVGLSGCCNYFVRTEDKDAPYACAPHPYYCTARVWSVVSRDAVRNPPPRCCAIPAAVEILVWPFSVVDEVCEVAFDTVFLPVDLTYLLVKEDDEGEATSCGKLE